MIELALLAFAATTGIGAFLVGNALAARRRDAQLLGLLATFGPACERARADPRVLLAWYPVALAGRRAFPQAFAVLDGDGQRRFPFGQAELEAYRALRAAGFRTVIQGVCMHRPHEPGYHRAGLFVIDDWR